MKNIELFARSYDVLGEGPLWSPDNQALYWLDIGRSLLHRRSLKGAEQSWSLPDRPGCVERLVGNDLALVFGAGVHRFDTRSGTSNLLCPVELPPGVRFNEGKADPRGRLWFGSMQDNFGPHGETVAIERSEGALFRLNDRGAPLVIEEKVGISNTLAWSPDHRRLYFADSLLDRIFVYHYDVATGDISGRKVFFEGRSQGLPDGSAMDADGCLWNTRWGAGVILRITPDGRVDRQIELPAQQPSSCAFGGPGMDILFVTSARNGMNAKSLHDFPLSGSVFAISGVGSGMPAAAMQWTG